MGILVSKTNQPTFMFKLAFFILPCCGCSAHCPPIPSPQCCVAWIMSIHQKLWLVMMTDGLVCGLHVEWHSFPPCLFSSLCWVPPFLTSAQFSSVNSGMCSFRCHHCIHADTVFQEGIEPFIFRLFAPSKVTASLPHIHPASGITSSLQHCQINGHSTYLHFTCDPHSVILHSVSMDGSCWEKDWVLSGYWLFLPWISWGRLLNYMIFYAFLSPAAMISECVDHIGMC